MINTIKTSRALGDPKDDRRPPRRDSEVETPPAPQPTAAPDPQADVRLVIEHDPANGGLIYKRIDRATGQVISEVSREDLMRMSADPGYTAGKMISTKV
jgi:hypothetical protein